MEAQSRIPSGLDDPCVLVGGQPRSGTSLLSSILRAAPGHLQAFEIHMRKPSFVVGLDGRYTRRIFEQTGLPADHYDRIVGETDQSGMNLGAWVGPKEEVSAEALTGRETDHFETEFIERAKLVTALMRTAAEVQDCRTWGFKILGDIMYADVHQRAWPNARFVLLIRDPRDQAVSLLRLNEQRAARQQQNFYDDYRAAADGWRRTIAEGRRVLRENGLAHFEVRYEDLVTNTDATLGRLSSFLDLDLAAGLRFHECAFVETHTSRFQHHDNLRKPINTDSVGRWRSALSERDAAVIEEAAGDLMSSLGYLDAN